MEEFKEPYGVLEMSIGQLLTRQVPCLLYNLFCPPLLFLEQMCLQQSLFWTEKNYDTLQIMFALKK